MIEKRRRPRSADRRVQVLNETLNLIMEQGIVGTTMTRIAEKVGITEPALYRHFRNRKEIMTAALDAAFKQWTDKILFQEVDAAAYLRHLATIIHGDLMNNPNAPRLVFEFICAPPAEELREPLIQYLLLSLRWIEYQLQEGIRQGVFREDIDLEVTAWEGFSLAFTLTFVNLMGLQEMLPEEKALQAVEDVISRISTGNRLAPRIRRKPQHDPRFRRIP